MKLIQWSLLLIGLCLALVSLKPIFQTTVAFTGKNSSHEISDIDRKKQVDKEYSDKQQHEKNLIQFGQNVGKANAYIFAKSTLRTIANTTTNREDLIEKLNNALEDSFQVYSRKAQGGI